MKLTLEALEVLDAIDKKGSFAGAATALFRVPSTITYMVQKLEDDLGFIIFRREGRRSILTPAGEVLLEQGRTLLLNAQRIVESAYQVNSGWESTLNIAIDTLWNLNDFYPILIEFHQLNTGVQINLTEEVMGGSLEAISDKRADIVIGGPLPVSNMQGIKFEKIMSATWEFVVARDHPLTQYELPLKEENIKPYPTIIIKDSSKNTPILSHRVFNNQTTVRVATMEQKIVAILQGVGVGFLPSHKIKQYITSGELVSLAINKSAPVTSQYCSWRINNKGKAMRWFVEKILAQQS
ncbi:LysR substrate-binding domain-containing protein [Pseudoalteromonas denitrificans]|uniref:DNA-binding transcriptional regulator, LysR family n=1 Tax=Pseudoalteromonas denitrificans DSM 6059 TaxID=1123010 RepID=A0A1I1SUZ6_9GAMM|nr:LysR substrate-binding domain-containing protein [Pseudoalteromonas denitrificans]SFD50329.1 DNA-binding transcriptional regulator, LysR family [Pseudoalteromonas denitrificans DSM 6059]